MKCYQCGKELDEYDEACLKAVKALYNNLPELCRFCIPEYFLHEFISKNVWS